MLLNAVLQWIPDHAALMPRLAAMLAPGGVLGFQMPGLLPGWSSKVHVLDIIRELTGEPEWRDKLSGVYADDMISSTRWATSPRSATSGCGRKPGTPGTPTR